MKIFAFVGSRNGKKSNTFIVIKQLIKELVNIGEQCVEYDIFTPQDLKLNSCQGCTTCFNQGFCPMDNVDQFDKIKAKLLSADIIIFGSPVYAASISSDMKVIIDRLSYWLHLMPLAGKIGVSVITASSNSVVDTNMYLKKIMESIGLQVACSVLCTVDAPNMIDSPTFKKELIPKYAHCINEYVMRRKEIIGTEYQERYFLNLRQNYDVPDKVDHAEARYWKDKGYINYNTYSELLKDIKNKTRI